MGWGGVGEEGGQAIIDGTNVTCFFKKSAPLICFFKTSVCGSGSGSGSMVLMVVVVKCKF